MKNPPVPFQTSSALAVLTVDVSPDGKKLVIGQCSDAATQLALGVWSLESHALEQAIIRGQAVMPLTARFSPDGKLLAFSDVNQDLVIHELASGNANRGAFPMASTKWLSFARDCNRLIVGGTRTQVWDADSRAIVFTLPVAPIPPTSDVAPPRCALSPDGYRVAASGVEPGCIVIYDVARGDIVGRIENTMDDARSMAFDPSGQYVAAVSRSGGAGLWCSETGEARLPDLLNKEADYYWCVQFHPDGKHIGLGMWSGFVVVIRIADGEYTEIQREPIHPGGVNDIVFARDGKSMFTGGDDGVVLVWEID